MFYINSNIAWEPHMVSLIIKFQRRCNYINMCSDVLCVIMQATHDDAYNMHLKMQHAQKHRNIFIIRTVYKSVANKEKIFRKIKALWF